MLYQLIYTSRACVLFDAEALTQLLTKARTFYASQHVTGLLLYSEGHFLQILEGTRPEVETVYALIRQDPRHEQLQLLGQGPVPRRAFPYWGMGFCELAYPVWAQLRDTLPLPGQVAAPYSLSLRDLLEPFVLHPITRE
ncbi:BLUF domain-containing protein [Hymenobacter volaticus]|uniref:BLUF domain-containing protein n=1 Tax=Hymenobacter volaticus TaxID=2932254 RepID=A0ABY4GFA5_9BACT|nr:BLUF domain-containing protein [Hymenobacter volaticus]UOQ69615.1 BLUF domain-containing protein [Hymenobacter volaticus]